MPLDVVADLEAYVEILEEKIRQKDQEIAELREARDRAYMTQRRTGW